MKFDIKEDLILLREFFHLSQEELAAKTGIDRVTLSRTEVGETSPRFELLDRIYSFCFDEGLKLNCQKEMLYKDDLKKEHILLSHALRNGIDGQITVDKGKAFNDFGKGFYCGDSYDKSASFVCRYPESSVYFIDFNPTNLKSIKFEVDTKWILAIAYLRGTLNDFKDSKILKDIIDPILKADYVIAPIADNRMFQIIDTFISGEITDEQCKHCLAATNLGMQYVFLSETSIKHLKVLERCFLSTSEKNYLKYQQIEFQKIGFDKSKMARIQYKGKGKYIEEILK